MTVTVDAAGAIDLLEGMGTRSLDLSPALAVIASDLASFVLSRFDESADPAGREWEKLADSTVKQRRGGSSTPLVDTGILRGSITAVSDKTSITVGSNVAYAGYQQFGTATTQYLEEGGTLDMVHVPARPFIPITWGGELMNEGPIAVEWTRYEEILAHFIETGEILSG